MLRIFNGVLILGLLSAAFVLYTLEHDTRRGERMISKLNRQIQEERQAIRLLEAEWSSLTRPQRLEQLAGEHLRLEPLNPLQYVSRKDLGHRLPSEALEPPKTTAPDPIADMLKVLQ